MVLAIDGKEVKGPLEHWQKANQRKRLCQRKRERKGGGKSKSLTPIPGQDLDIPLVVGGALVVGDTTLSPLTGGLNANESYNLMMMQPLEKTPSHENCMMK